MKENISRERSEENGKNEAEYESRQTQGEETIDDECDGIERISEEVLEAFSASRCQRYSAHPPPSPTAPAAAAVDNEPIDGNVETTRVD
jgi:hypothetical protein